MSSSPRLLPCEPDQHGLMCVGQWLQDHFFNVLLLKHRRYPKTLAPLAPYSLAPVREKGEGRCGARKKSEKFCWLQNQVISFKRLVLLIQGLALRPVRSSTSPAPDLPTARTAHGSLI